MDWKWSPEQIGNQLKQDFPAEEAMRVSPGTIYRSIFIQARGALRRDVELKLRTGRVTRKPRKQSAGNKVVKSRSAGLVMIANRPVEVGDRAVPGHWEGDLIMSSRNQSRSPSPSRGRGRNQSQIGTLVERSTRYYALCPSRRRLMSSPTP